MEVTLTCYMEYVPPALFTKFHAFYALHQILYGVTFMLLFQLTAMCYTENFHNLYWPRLILTLTYQIEKIQVVILNTPHDILNQFLLYSHGQLFSTQDRGISLLVIANKIQAKIRETRLRPIIRVAGVRGTNALQKEQQLKKCTVCIKTVNNKRQ